MEGGREGGRDEGNEKTCNKDMNIYLTSEGEQGNISVLATSKRQKRRMAHPSPFHL